MKHSPPLSTRYSFSVNTTVTYDETSSYSHKCWHYYLHEKSYVTLRACVNSNCDPYHIYIVKGPQNYANWLNTPHNEGVLSLIQKYAPLASQAVWATLSKKIISTISSVIHAMEMIMTFMSRQEIYLFILRNWNIQSPTFRLKGCVTHTNLVLAHWSYHYKLDQRKYWLPLVVS